MTQVDTAPDGTPEPPELLVERALGGDAGAFERLVSRFQGPAWGLARRIVGDREMAAEMVQEAFLKVHVHRTAFRAGERFEPWFYRILTNLCLNAARRRRLQETPSDPVDLGLSAASDARSPDRVVQARDADARLARAFDRLPARYRAAMALRVHAGMSVEEIARALSCPDGTVKTLLFRARELLRAWTEGERR